LIEPQIRGQKIVSIYFGGGTPALIGPEAIATILSWIPNRLHDIEITLEANPENVTIDLMKAYAAAGINRVSIGVQTLDDTLLLKLNRTHNADKAQEAIHSTFEAGITNISADLMYDLPTQNLTIWESTLKSVKDLPLTHISLYNLTIEPNTTFFKYKKTIETQMPDGEMSLSMYQMARDHLTKAGFHQYEISAFAKENRHSNHNIGYWIGRPFLGLGPSAFSYWEGRRFRNVANLQQYSEMLFQGQLPIDFEEELSPDKKVRELLAVNLRLMHGVDLEQFQVQHGALNEEIKNTLRECCDEGYLSWSESVIKLTERGVLFYDSVASELV